MFHDKKIVLFALLIPAVVALLLAGCAPATPRLIAAAQSTPIAVFPTAQAPSVRMITVYNLVLDLMVDDTRSAASEALRMTNAYGGYLVTSQSWYENGDNVVFMELAVPDAQSARLHTDLLTLGRMTAENYFTFTNDCYTCHPYAHIMLYLRGGSTALPTPSSPGWNPLNTLRSAFGVFVRIFGFIADGVIWVVVVAGPFILIGWAGVLLFKFLRKRSRPL